MDLKLVFYVLSLILLVAYGAEARKIAEGNTQGKRLNFPLAKIHLSSNGDLQNKEDTQNNQGYNYNHQQANTENAQASNIFLYGDLQNKDDTQNYNHQQASTENAQASNIFLYDDLQHKDDTQNYNHQQASAENAQASNIFLYDDLQHKDDTQNYNHQQASAENAQASNIFLYNDLQYKDDTQNYNHQQASAENAQASNIFLYDDLQHKDDTQNYNHQQASAENAKASNIFLYDDLQHKDDTQNYNHQQASTENAQASNIFLYDDLQHKDDTQNYNHQQANTENAQASNIFLYNDLQNKDDTQTSWIHNKKGENKHEQANTENAHIHSSDHIDPSVRVFFLLDDLKVSREISVSFPRRASNFLPKDEADSIPFSRKGLPNLLQRFAISKNSPQAKTMEETLRVCEIPPIKGETKYCATSPEAMLDFVQGIMGEKTQIKPLSTIHSSNSTPLLQKYTVLDAPREVETPKMVACHTMPYAYAIFYCHYTVSKSKVFKVSLRGENGDRVEAIAVCHLDTSDWSPSHISFRLLGVLPGTSPICHFFPSGHLVWVSKITNARVI